MDDFADLYPVSNTKERPGIGRAFDGSLSYNCFAIHLSRDRGGAYEPYTLGCLIQELNEYRDSQGPCDRCIAQHRRISFPTDDVQVDRSAVAAKFAPSWDRHVDAPHYWYCPMVHATLVASRVTAIGCDPDGELPAEPMQAILSGSWDDPYLFRFEAVGQPQHLDTCRLVAQTLRPLCMAPAEEAFLRLWMRSMWAAMGGVADREPGLYLEDADFAPTTSKLLGFVVPVPQAWVQVIAPPPPGKRWDEWNRDSGAGEGPQRVDFLVVHGGKRHVIELDDVGHYGEKRGGEWRASEQQYRQTLRHARLLARSGYIVHRFTNAEVLELDRPDVADTAGFLQLLEGEGLDPVELCLPATSAPRRTSA